MIDRFFYPSNFPNTGDSTGVQQIAKQGYMA